MKERIHARSNSRSCGPDTENTPDQAVHVRDNVLEAGHPPGKRTAGRPHCHVLALPVPNSSQADRTGVWSASFMTRCQEAPSGAQLGKAAMMFSQL